MKRTLPAVILVLSLTLMAVPTGANAQTAARDHSSNAMVKGGAYSLEELRQKVKASPTVREDFRSLGVTMDELSAKRMVNGTVTKDGNVVVDGKTVATGARSYGREDLGNSVQEARGLYSRPTSTSFEQRQLPAYVYMTNGAFEYAIIKSCGNFVKATPSPVVKPAAQPVPQPAPQPAPPVIVVHQTQTQTQTQTTPAPTPAPAAQPLPKTGASAAGAALGLAAITTTGLYYRRSQASLLATARSGLNL